MLSHPLRGGFLLNYTLTCFYYSLTLGDMDIAIYDIIQILAPFNLWLDRYIHPSLKPHKLQDPITSSAVFFGIKAKRPN
jgi:hypothetical protein